MNKGHDDVFRRAGRRSTTQRRLILGALEEGGGHLDAEAVHDRVKAADPRISLATVYRSLAVLREIGLVDQQRLGEDHGHFEVVRDGPHYHFTCRQCGTVIEFDSPEIERIARRLKAREGVEITDVQLSLAGYCAKCAGKPERAAGRLRGRR